MTIRLTPSEFFATRDRIAKINERAVKRGFTGRLDVVGERVEVTRRNDFGFPEVKVFYDTDITGTPPGYGGWTFLARVDIEDGGLIVHGAPGAPQVDRTLLKPGWCDHCQTQRRRTKTFVVGKDGDQKQVGTTCINDFLGWEGKVVFFTEDQFTDDDDLWGGGGGGEAAWTIDTILGVAWAVTATFGYVRTTGDWGKPTRDATFDFLTGFTKDYTDDEIARVRGLAPQAQVKAVEVREFIASDEFTGDSDYVTNLKTLVAGEFATHRQIGLLASAPQALNRHREQQVKREVEQAERADYVNEWIGNVKDRLTLNVTVKAIRFIDGHYGTTTLYTMLTDDNHVVKWFSSNYGLGEDVEGQQFRITGTVKNHDEWEGQKQTVLTRVKGEPIGVPVR